ncbi:MAG: hypothetical protein L3K11_03760 [Thermoplasmata archaeon]|nr:hypothetical protein [Thermoplasmata archaeon]
METVATALDGAAILRNTKDDRAAVNARIFVLACALKYGRMTGADADLDRCNVLAHAISYDGNGLGPKKFEPRIRRL